MVDVVQIVRINVQEQESGLLCATSPDLPGLVVVHRELAAIRDDLPNIIKLIFKRRYKKDVEVREAKIPDRKQGIVPDWAAIPVLPAQVLDAAE